VERVLGELIGAARESLGPTLRSAVLYGSAAEGRLRATSDVNLILVLTAFEGPRVDGLREALRIARAAAGVEAMFLLESEIPSAAARFAPKFSAILRRRKVLHGPDPFVGLAIPREREVERLRSEALNLVLRLRASYAGSTLRDDDAVLALSEAAGPLRALAAVLAGLEGSPAPSSREALRSLAAAAGPTVAEAVERMSQARETGSLPRGAAAPALLTLIDLAVRIRDRAEAVR
jgi:predicted nucleotidyltransferase